MTAQLDRFDLVKKMIFGEDSAILRVPSDVRKRAQKIVEEAVEQTQMLKDMVQGKFNSWGIAYTCDRGRISCLNGLIFIFYGLFLDYSLLLGTVGVSVNK